MARDIQLYEIRENVTCNRCGNKGAVRLYGVLGQGGVVPWTCLNCNNTGLIDFTESGNFEGFRGAFTTIK